MEETNCMIKIVFTGPECSGKTTFSQLIAKKYSAPLVQEYAREYLNNLKHPYGYKDLLQIAKGQLRWEKSNQKKANNLLVCDTNLQVIKIWSKIKFKKCDPFILKHQDLNAYYILCYPDIKWEYDPLRENPNERKKILQEYQKELIAQKQKFITLKGSYQNRLDLLTSKIDKMIE